MTSLTSASSTQSSAQRASNSGFHSETMKSFRGSRSSGVGGAGADASAVLVAWKKKNSNPLVGLDGLSLKGASWWQSNLNLLTDLPTDAERAPPLTSMFVPMNDFCVWF